MHTRQSALNEWLESSLNNTSFTLKPLAGDASFRRYFRVHHNGQTHIVMDAPPEKEGITTFVRVAAALAQQGIHTPTIFAIDEKQGFILLEDLGDILFLNALSAENANPYYLAAIETLNQIQQCSVKKANLPNFDKLHMQNELDLFRTWFLSAYLGIELDAHDEEVITQTFNTLISDLASQPQVFIHRDYHSRNLMVINTKTETETETDIKLGVIDFQDAMCGPITYDLVSLLKDCYIQWPPEKIAHWVAYFYKQERLSNVYSLKAFTRAFDLCGLQRHLKVLGIFCRLHLRDNKSNYLKDLPLTFNYVMSCLESYAELQPMYEFMQKKIQAVFLDKQ